MVKLNVLGLNCGTSVDGVDVALVCIESHGDDVTLQLLHYSEQPVPAALRGRILALCRPSAATSLEEVCDLNVEIGEVFADAVISSGVDLGTVDLIASHGQTLWHHPVPSGRGGWGAGERRAATLQMGESTVLQQRTGITVASDFRTAEVAAGRQGAPLSGLFEAALLRSDTLRVCQNIGGMANATVVPADPGRGYFAFDTGPGNVLIDCAVRVLTQGREQYDADGARALAGAGEIDEAFVEAWLAGCAYLHRPPPKTTGRELFSDALGAALVAQLRRRGLGPDGIVATLTRLTAESIARALRRFVVGEYGPMGELLLCGGGAHNPVLAAHLAAAFPETQVRKLDDALPQTGAGMGLPAAAKEAVLFALLGFLCVTGRRAPVSALESSKAETVMGKLTPGANFRALLRRALAEEGGVLGRVSVV